MRINRKSLVVVGVVAAAAAVWAAQDAPILIMDGRTVSSNLRQADGTLMVPVRDVATALGYEVRESTGRIELVRNASGGGLGNQGSAFPPPAFVPSSGIGTGSFSSFTPRPRAELSSRLGEDVSYGGFTHRLVAVTYPGREYRQEFDPRRRKLRAPFGEEQLVVLRMSVTNNGNEAAYAPTPSTFGASVFDETKIGYPVTAVDARQAGGVQSNDSLIATNGQSVGNILLAPGGSVEYALVASVPKERKVTQAVLNLPSSPRDTATSGAVLTLGNVEP
ncbi:MAG: hypothetical protein ACO1SV_26780 [Fimbriimonas sp.]